MTEYVKPDTEAAEAFEALERVVAGTCVDVGLGKTLMAHGVQTIMAAIRETFPVQVSNPTIQVVTPAVAVNPRKQINPEV